MAHQKLLVLAACNTHIHTHTQFIAPWGVTVCMCGCTTWPCKADALSCSLVHDENASTRTWHASPRAAATTGVNFCIMFFPSTRKTQNEKHKQIGCAAFKACAESFDCLLDRHLDGIPHPCYTHGALIIYESWLFYAKGELKVASTVVMLVFSC